jgi:chromosome partitioning protein
MRTLSFINLKGGPGKTTLATNTAAAFARQGAKVLVIDNDKQGNASAFFGVKIEDLEGTLAALYLSDAKVEDAIHKTNFMNVDLIPGNMYLKLVEITLMQKNNTIPQTILIEKLKSIFDQYDLCIIDNPPDVGVTVINSLLFTDDVIIMTTPHIYSINGVDEIYQQLGSIRGKKLNVKCLFNQYIASDLSLEYKNKLNEKYPVFESSIRFNRKFLQIAEKEKKPIFEVSPRCGFSQDLFHFLRELTKE